MLEPLQTDRRSLLEHLALLLGVAVLPASALAAPKRRTQRFLATSPYALLSAVADTLIPVTDTPGALAAQVPQKLDAMLGNWASLKTKEDISSALAAIEQATQVADRSGFAALSPDRRKVVLVEHDKAALRAVPRREKLSGLAALMAAPSVADPGYYKLKSMILALYYNSEIAMTQEVIYEHVPGKWVPSLKITPGMHSFAGAGGAF